MFLWVFPLVIIGIVGVFVGLWAWTVYIENAKPGEIRRALQIFFAILVVIEFLLWTFDRFKDNTIYFLVIMLFWGMFDAIIRFPVVHDLDTFFSIKQVAFVGLRTMVYAIGFRNLGKNAIFFLICLFANVWCVPLLYVMALPIGDTRAQNSKTDCLDIDLAMKIWLLVGAKNDMGLRREYANYYRVNFEWAVQSVAHVPGARPVLQALGLVNKSYGKTREI